MQCDLESCYANLAEKIPMSAEGEFIFFDKVLPIPPIHMATDQIVIQKSFHGYNSWFRADILRIHSSKKSCRHLGLLILSVIFHPEISSVHLKLTNSASVIKNLIIEFDHTASFNRYPGYITRPYQFQYFPRDMPVHPWVDENPHPSDLPCFWLTNEDDMVIREDEWNDRNTVLGLGNDEGTIRFADLLLNASRPQNTVEEYMLEGEAGFRGVGKLSAEVALVVSEG